jgi:hypothetical protein
MEFDGWFTGTIRGASVICVIFDMRRDVTHAVRSASENNVSACLTYARMDRQFYLLPSVRLFLLLRFATSLTVLISLWNVTHAIKYSIFVMLAATLRSVCSYPNCQLTFLIYHSGRVQKKFLGP